MSTARYFDEDKAEGRHIPGIPARDISEDEWRALPDYLQRSADASDIYRKTKPRTAATTDKEGDD